MRPRHVSSLLAAVALLTGTVGAPAAAAGAPATRDQAALAFATRMRLSLPSAGPVTRAQAVEAIDTAAGLLAQTPSTPTYADVTSTSSAYGAIEAAVKAGLMAGWAPTSGDFRPSAPMTRIDLAVLATNAMGLTSQAGALGHDATLYGPFNDSLRPGFDLGFANLMMKYGIVPPMDRGRYAARGRIRAVGLALAFERMWRDMDVPVSGSVTPSASEVLTGSTDALTLHVQNRLGTSVPSANLSRYLGTYGVSGGTGAGAVTDSAFTSRVGGVYTVSMTLKGPLMRRALTLTGTVTVKARPFPPAAPTAVTAREVAGGLSVTWTPGTSVQGYQLLEAVNGAATYTPVSPADGGTPPAYAQGATVTGVTNGDSYRFEVEGVGTAGATATSAASPAVLYGVTAPTGLSFSSSGASGTLSWTAGGGEAAYQVLAAANGAGTYTGVSSADGGTPSATSTTATLTGLAPGDAYTFELKATNAFGLSATSGASAAGLYDFTAPSGVIAAVTPAGALDLAWTPGVGQTGEAIYEAVSPSTTYTLVSGADGGTVAASASRATISGLTLGKSYTFKVEALDANATPTATLSATTAHATQYGVAAPTGVAATEVTGGIRVSWTAPAGAASYQVLEQVGGSGPYSAVPASDGGTPTTASTTVTGLTAGDTYAFEVEAKDAAGNISAPSAPTGTVGYGAAVSAAFTAGTKATGTITLNKVQGTPVPATGSFTVISGTGSGTVMLSVQASGGSGIGSPTIQAGTSESSVESDTAFMLQGFKSSYPAFTYSQSTSGTTFSLSYPGAFGNGIILYTTNPGVVEVNDSTTAAYGYLSGGENADAIKVGGTTFDAVASSPTGDQYTTYTNLASAISGAGLGVTATATGTDQVDLAAAAYGPASDLALSVNNAADASFSGATMTGGVLPVVTLTFTNPIATSTLSATNFATVLGLPAGVTFGSGAAASWNAADTVLTITCGSNANVTAGETITIPSSVTDAAGNPVAPSVTL